MGPGMIIFGFQLGLLLNPDYANRLRSVLGN